MNPVCIIDLKCLLSTSWFSTTDQNLMMSSEDECILVDSSLKPIEENSNISAYPMSH